jgi:2-iminobutanoate/2-iminopropanoate deaminase
MKSTIATDAYRRPEGFGPWSAGVIVPAGSSLLMTPGMVARDHLGRLVSPGDVVGQTRRIFAQLAEVLRAAGADLDDVVKLGVFLTSLDDAAKVQTVRNEIWPVDPPVSFTVEVAKLVEDDVMVEIEAIAAISESER